MDELKGRVAVITGGGSGIGRGMAHAFAEAGMHVVIADIEQSAGAKVADELGAYGVRAMAVVTDVANRESVDALADRIVKAGAAEAIVPGRGVGRRPGVRLAQPVERHAGSVLRIDIDRRASGEGDHDQSAHGAVHTVHRSTPLDRQKTGLR